MAGISAPWAVGLAGAITVVGGLAAAWWGVSKAVDAAGAGMGRTAAQRIAGGPGGNMTDRPTVQQLMQQLPEGMRARLLDAGSSPTKFADVVDAQIKESEAALQRARQQAPRQILDEELQARRKFDFMEEEHKYLRQVYQAQLEKYQSTPAGRGATAIPETAPEFKEVVNERNRSVTNLKREAAQINIELTPADLGQFDLQKERGRGPFARMEFLRQFPELQQPKRRNFDDAAIRGAEGLLTSLQKIREEAGASMKRDLKLPFQSRYTTFDAYGESLQIKLLEGNELTTANEISQLRKTIEAIDPGGMLRELVKNTAELKTLMNILRAR
jgi:hypothetical protein